MLYIKKNAENNYTFDRAGLDAVTMRKTAMGWTIEAVELSFWDDSKRTTFLWVAETARDRQGLPAQPALHRAPPQKEGLMPSFLFFNIVVSHH